MKGKSLLFALLLIAGTSSLLAHDSDGHDHDHDHDHDDEDVVDIEDDLDNGAEEELKHETSAPPLPKVTYRAPVPTGEVYFAENFDKGTLEGWFLSKAKKDDTDDEIAKYDGKWEVQEMKDTKLPGDKGLVLISRAKHHAISAKLNKPFIFDTKPLIVQYEVNFQNGIECGGAYVKLLTKSNDLNLDQFHDKTPYTIMFGPDKCGEDYKLHFIFRHKNPKTGQYEEKHAKRPEADLKNFFTDKKTHLYTLGKADTYLATFVGEIVIIEGKRGSILNDGIVNKKVLNPDNSFEVLIDQTVVNTGNLLSDMTPPVNPPREIEDPNDQKPEDWDERAKIPDPDAVKPDDWDEDAPAKIPDEDALKPEGWLDDEPEYVADPDAEKPEDWDEDMDGEWEAPQIANPKCESAPGCGTWQRPTIDNPNYKGKWKPTMIDNPNYQGIWKPRKIPNPDFFEDLQPFKMTPFNAVGFELWSMTSDIFFDNFIICTERAVADDWGNDGWGLKKAADGAAEPGVVTQMMTAAEERPWLWIVYILTVALPVFLVVLFCCSGKTKQPSAAEYKKTDAPQPDVNEEEKVEEKEKEEEDEEDEEEEESNEKKPEEKDRNDGNTENVSQEEEAEEEEEEEVEMEEEEESKDITEEEETVNRSPRNRKPRRE